MNTFAQASESLKLVATLLAHEKQMQYAKISVAHIVAVESMLSPLNHQGFRIVFELSFGLQH